MEIQYTKFKQWTEFVHSLAELSPSDVIGEQNLSSYINGIKPILTKKEEELLADSTKKISSFWDIYSEVQDEIEINIVTLATKERIAPYFQYIKSKHLNAFHNLKNHLNYDWIRESKIIWDEHIFVPHEEYTPPLESNLRTLTGLDKLMRLKDGYGIYFEEDGSVSGYSKRLHDDFISIYLEWSMGLISLFDQMQDLIEEKIKCLDKRNESVKKIEPKSLFKNGIDIQPYLEILKKVKPPILNEKGEYILGVNSHSKGSIVVWVDHLERKGLLNNISDAQKALLINELIPNFEISEKSLRSADCKVSRAYMQYDIDIDYQLNLIK